MASPKNYERVKSEERRTRPFFWRHKGNGPEIRVTESKHSRGKYRISVPAFPPHHPQETLGWADSKEEARKKAVKWMRNHPNGGKYTH